MTTPYYSPEAADKRADDRESCGDLPRLSKRQQAKLVKQLAAQCPGCGEVDCICPTCPTCKSKYQGRKCEPCEYSRLAEADPDLARW